MNKPKRLMPELWKSVGGLSEPSKMPCYGYSISARKCKTGSKLRKVPGSVCSICYAFAGHYNFSRVKNCLDNRFEIMTTDPEWVNNMVEIINTKGLPHFRWFDSGDLQSTKMLHDIVQICIRTPTITHWLPTREYGVVSSYINSGKVIPKNLVIRLSGFMIDGPSPIDLATRLGVQTSRVATSEGITCPAYKQDAKCMDCRKCWDKNVSEIVYKFH